MLSMNPNTHEEWLNHTWINQVARFSSAHILESEWVIRCEAHFLGGMRHFERWEIADIGVLVHLRLRPGEHRSKAVTLQSKRLYPVATPIREETQSDYRYGLSRLSDPESVAVPVAYATEYVFTDESQYRAMSAAQVERIAKYEKRQRVPVYYHFYNPWSVPFQQTVPIAGYERPLGQPDTGVRVIPSAALHRVLPADPATLTFGHLRDLGALPSYGWRIEDFICDEVIGCREGHPYESNDDPAIRALFGGRTAPISAAVAVTIEAPDFLNSVAS